MSQQMMRRRCIHCYRMYPYDPAVQDFGSICKHCHGFQIIRLVFHRLDQSEKGKRKGPAVCTRQTTSPFVL